MKARRNQKMASLADNTDGLRIDQRNLDVLFITLCTDSHLSVFPGSEGFEIILYARKQLLSTGNLNPVEALISSEEQ